MNNFIIFDSALRVGTLGRNILPGKNQSFFLFPLTADAEVIDGVKEIIINAAGNKSKMILIEAAKIIDQQVDRLRQRVHRLSGEIGNIIVGHKTIKEWFALPDGDLSTWWFSEIAEKNPIKNQSFFKLAQVKAIDDRLGNQTFHKCLLSVSDPDLAKTIKLICRKRGVPFLKIVNDRIDNLTIREKFQNYLDSSNGVVVFSRALISLVVRLVRSVHARIRLHKVNRSFNNSSDEVLFVSYFPCVDPISLARGELKNKFAIGLEDKIKQLGKKIIWLWLFVYVDNRSYREAIKLAEQLLANEETGFLLDEFLTVPVFFKVLFLWLRQILVYYRIKRRWMLKIKSKMEIVEQSIIMKKMCARSFIGWPGLEAILYYELFSNVWRHFSKVKKCLHFAEFHPWEVALNASKNALASNVKTIGLQHTTISPNYFFYFRHPLDFESKKYKYPPPDVIAANGDIPLSVLEKNFGLRVVRVSANRYLYLADYIDKSESKDKGNTVIVATSANKKESEEIVSLAIHALRGEGEIEVFFKGHPCFPLDKLMNRSFSVQQYKNFHLTNKSISSLLDKAKILIVGDSSVALEALALGCAVIIPVLSNWMFLSPLKGQEQFYTRVYNSEELKKTVDEILREQKSIDPTAAKNFIKRYWCLDKSLSSWEALLK